MKTSANRSLRPYRLLVLVPHRDARLPLRAWSASLFSAGLPGAWSFPWLIPLAAVKHPYSGEALKSLAHSMRRHIGGGKCTATEAAAAVFPGSRGDTGIAVFGPALNIALPAHFFGDTAEPFSPLVIGAALLYGNAPPALPPAPPISFRAAAVANMVIKPLVSGENRPDNYSFAWNIGAPHWLPRTKKP